MKHRKYFVDVPLVRGWVFQPFAYILTFAYCLGFKVIKEAPKTKELPTKTWFYSKRFHVLRGDTSYMVESRIWYFGFTAMFYHQASPFRGINIRVSLSRASWLRG